MNLPLSAYPIYAYSRARSANYAIQFISMTALASLLPGFWKKMGKDAPPLNLRTLQTLHRELNELLQKDASRISRGLYPLSVIHPESPMQHFTRIPKLLTDGLRIYGRRMRGRTTEFDRHASDLLDDVPRYYRRNFHFQTDGYLSSRSAEVYEHQVELLFQGTADAMRRLILPPMVDAFASRASSGGKGLRLLEIGAGTGRATRFVRQTLPKARITATDLSDPYLKHAQKRLKRYTRIDFVQADGAALPFKDGEFDCVYSVFLFHELPLEARRAVLQEARRVLKPGGHFGFVDSLQTGDREFFDPFLAQFPQDYHEPFFRDYISRPMERLLTEEGYALLRSETGFTSKMTWARRSS